MKRFLHIPACGVVLLLAACASAPTYGPADDEAMAPVRQAHQDCLQSTIQSLIDGSDDVNFLTQHIVKQCDDTLTPAADYLAKRGFNSYQIGQFMQQQRQIGADATANVILRVKAMQNDGSAF